MLMTKIGPLIFFLLFYFSSPYTLLAVEKDQAIFRVEARPFFLKDIKELLSDLSVLKCVDQNSKLFLSMLDKQNNIVDFTSLLTLNPKNISEHRARIFALINLVKVVDFVSAGPRPMRIPPAAVLKKCQKSPALSKVLSELFATHFFLQENYSQSAEKADNKSDGLGLFFANVRSKVAHFEYY